VRQKPRSTSTPHVLVAGAGLAGLTAARQLEATGLRVTVIDARDRVGGRVSTIRDGFAGGQFAEGGADFIDSGQDALLELIHEVGLRTTRILRGGFGYYGPDRRGRLRRQSLEEGFEALGGELHPLIHALRLAEGRTESPIVRDLARESVASWLKRIKASPSMIARYRGLRGLFLADPEDLSLLALVDFVADLDEEGWDAQYRVLGGNDRLATEIARRLRGTLHLSTVLRALRQDERGVIASVDRGGGVDEIAADYVVVTLPASTLRDVQITPALPETQQDAIRHLKYGTATKVMVQFERRFWARRDRPHAYGTDQGFGAVWDGNEQQARSASGKGILTFLAGGRASDEIQALLKSRGVDGLARQLAWLGRPARPIAIREVVWETEPWSRGGYAVFDPSFEPRWRDWLARPAGRIVFAGEHTSIRWQGYVNGAVESGQRAAWEVQTYLVSGS